MYALPVQKLTVEVAGVTVTVPAPELQESPAQLLVKPVEFAAGKEAATAPAFAKVTRVSRSL